MSHSQEPRELEAVAAALRHRLPDAARLGVSLAPYCTYRVGGAAHVFVEIDSVSTLETVAEVVADRIPILIVGRGSNLLVSDAGFAGVAVQLGPAFATVAVDPETARLTAGATTLLPVAARQTAAAGLTGFEWAVGVPGSIGGAVRMNAGGHGSDVAATLRSVDVLDLRRGDRARRSAAQLELGYRRSNLDPAEVVLAAEFQLAIGDVERCEAEIAEIVRWRRANQPGGQNAGSVFANPEGDSAGRLIDAAGLKGRRVGTAEVSTKHANFIQADPGGSADDVYALMQEIQRVVQERFGVGLHPENRLIGFSGGVS